jgi:hypothetical protein
MVREGSNKRLEIRKSVFWELWLITPQQQVILGIFPTLEELHRAEKTLCRAWESRQALEPTPVRARY